VSSHLYEVADDDDFGAGAGERHDGRVVARAPAVSVSVSVAEEPAERPQRRPADHVADRATDEHVERAEQPAADRRRRRLVPAHVRTEVPQPRRQPLPAVSTLIHSFISPQNVIPHHIRLIM